MPRLDWYSVETTFKTLREGFRQRRTELPDRESLTWDELDAVFEECLTLLAILRREKTS